MMTMTELFYGPIEPTWIVHPEYPVYKRPNGQIGSENPYLTCADQAFTNKCYPYMQRISDGAPVRPGYGSAMHPYQAQYFVRGASGANAVLNHNSAEIQKHRPGVLQPRNAMNTQTVHFMVPLCCDKCEDTVKGQLLDLDDVQRVTCDQWKQKVTVTSAIAPERLLKRLQKIKKRTTFWPHQKSGVVNVFNGNQVKAQRQKTNDSENQEDENFSGLQLESD